MRDGRRVALQRLASILFLQDLRLKPSLLQMLSHVLQEDSKGRLLQVINLPQPNLNEVCLEFAQLTIYGRMGFSIRDFGCPENIAIWLDTFAVHGLKLLKLIFYDFLQALQVLFTFSLIQLVETMPMLTLKDLFNFVDREADF